MLSEQQQRIMGYFIEEAKDHLNTIEQGLLNLQATIADPEMVSEVFRAAHSVKGGAAMLGLDSIQQTAHRLEDYFKLLKECPVKVDQKLETLSLRVFDTLQELLEQLQGPFGLTEDKASEVMANVEPVFTELNQHLSDLVSQSGGIPPEDVDLPQPVLVAPVVQPVNREESALRLVFQSDVPSRLREMLQLFKQTDTADSRQQLQEISQTLARMGEQFDIPTWGELLEMARRSIANPNNTYRTLAPVLIKDIKQAHELVLAGRSPEIDASSDLKALVPALPDLTDTDFGDLLTISDLADEADAPDLFDFSAFDAPDLSDIDIAEDDNWFTDAPTPSQPSRLDQLGFDPLEPTNSATDEELGFDYPLSKASAHPSGPEVGIAELNSLADLFEQEVPDLDMTWQEEAIVSDRALPIDDSGDNLFESLDLDASSDFSDLLFDEDALALPIEADDDLSGLLNRSESIAAPGQTVPLGEKTSPTEDLRDLLSSDFFEEDHSDTSDFSELTFTDAVPNPLSPPSDRGNSTGSSSDLGNLDELFDSLEDGELVFGSIDQNAAASDLSSLFEADLNDSNELFSIDSPDDTEVSLPEAIPQELRRDINPTPLESADNLTDLSFDWAAPADETDVPADALGNAFLSNDPVDPQTANAVPWTIELDASLFDESGESAIDSALVWDEQDVSADLWDEANSAEQAVPGEMAEANFSDADPFAVAETGSQPESAEAAPLPVAFTALDTEGAETTDLNDLFDLSSESDAAQPLPPLASLEEDLEWLTLMEPIEANEAMGEARSESIDLPASDHAVALSEQYSETLRLFGDDFSETPAGVLPAGAMDKAQSETIDSDLDVDLSDLFDEETETSETDWLSLAESQPAVNEPEADLGGLFGEETPEADLLKLGEPAAVDEIEVDLGDLFGEEPPEVDSLLIIAEPAVVDELEVDLGDLFSADNAEVDLADELAIQAEPMSDWALPAAELPQEAAEPAAEVDEFADLFTQDFFETAEPTAADREGMMPAEDISDLLLDLDDSDPQADLDLDFLSTPQIDAIEAPISDLDFSIGRESTDDLAITPNQTADDLDEDLSWLMEDVDSADADSGAAVRPTSVPDADDDLDWLGEAELSAPSTAEWSAADDLQPGLDDRSTGETEFDAAMLDFDAIDLTNASAELDELDSVNFGSSDLEADESSEESDIFALDAPAAAPDLTQEDDPDGLDDLFSDGGIFASDANRATGKIQSETTDLADLQNLNDLDSFLDQPSTDEGASASDSTGDLDLWSADEGFVTEPIAADSSGFDDLDALLDDVAEAANAQAATADNFEGLDMLLGEDAFAATAPVVEAASDEFDDLDALLNHAPAAETASSDLDDFADLEAFLDDEMPTSSISGFNESNEEDFADLEALLSGSSAPGVSSPPQESPAGEFDDLEKLLEDADQTLGGSATNRGVRRPSLTPKKRSPGVLNDQTMRVSVKNLDNLNNLVGELVVNRNSLEQTQERLRQFLDNLLYQVQQLSDVGQRMRDLYERSLLESSLLSSRRSYQLSGSSSSAATPAQSNHSTGMSFDALEMDRFTGFHTLSQEMIELIVRVRESASDIDFVVDESDQVTRMFRQVTTQLQEGLTRSRMVPFDQTAARLPRAVRDISVKCGKQAELAIEGKDTLIDKMILEQLYDPMTHLVNNAITHGIETPEERRAAGKPPMGRITIRAFHQGNQTVISVTDDGAGIDPEKVKRKAIEKRIVSTSEARSMTRLDVYDLLFQHGFSTRDKADDFAGRGVGMDVVRTSLNEIRGSVNIDSTVGRGTTFTIRLPLTLSISKALCCISNRARIAFPMDGVEDMLDIPKEQIQTDAEGRTCIQWRDSLLPFQPLSELLKYSRILGRGSVYGGNQEDDVISVVVLRSNAGSFIALQVDQVLGEQEIVIKQLEGPVPKPIGVAGATVLGDGHIMPIADVLELIDLSFGRIRRETGSSLWEKEDQIPVEPQVTKTDPTVLIVDDSITVRELLSMTFNKIGYRVEQARDGQEAWEKLRAGLPCDLVFCDIEMPRMDGLELLSRIQKDPNLSHLPIAMLTSRGADRHRQMAVQLGAKGYFTKPYLEEALLDAAQRMLKGEVLVG